MAAFSLERQSHQRSVAVIPGIRRATHQPGGVAGYGVPTIALAHDARQGRTHSTPPETTGVHCSAPWQSATGPGREEPPADPRANPLICRVGSAGAHLPFRVGPAVGGVHTEGQLGCRAASSTPLTPWHGPLELQRFLASVLAFEALTVVVRQLAVVASAQTQTCRVFPFRRFVLAAPGSLASCTPARAALAASPRRGVRPGQPSGREPLE